MEWLVLLLNFALFTFLAFLLNYYRRLFGENRDTYNREEIIHPTSHALSEVKRVSENHVSLFVGSYTVGGLFGLLVSSFGGLYGYYSESYLFLSMIVPALVFIGLPYIHDALEIDIEAGTFLGKVFQQDLPFVLGMTSMVLARMWTAYAFYHRIGFWWVLLNTLAGFALLLYAMYRDENEKVMEAVIREENQSDSGSEEQEQAIEK